MLEVKKQHQLPPSNGTRGTMFLYYAAICLLKTFFYLFLIIVLLLLIAKVCFEPISRNCKCETSLQGKVALVTGGNSGIGLETARDLARRGATVVIACRDERKAEEAIADIARTTGNTNVQFRYLDLFKPACIREFAEKFNGTFDRLDILVNNAGCAGCSPKLSENGVELTMQVNHVGPFLLTSLLLDKLTASKPSRIVIVSSKLHYFGKLNLDDLAGVGTDGSFRRYANSKLCNVLWAKALASRLPEGVTVNSMHPGYVETNIFERIPYFSKIIKTVARLLFKTSREGAQTVIHLCVAPQLACRSGGYYTECKLRGYYRVARDEELMHRVWAESTRLSEQ